MKCKLISCGARPTDAWLTIPLIVVSFLLIASPTGVSGAFDLEDEPDDGPSRTRISRIQKTLENGDLEGFLKLSLTPLPRQFGVLRHLFGAPQMPKEVWDPLKLEVELLWGGTEQVAGVPASSPGLRNSTDDAAVALRWRTGVAVPSGGRACLSNLELESVDSLPVQRSLEETGVTVAQYGLVFPDSRLKILWFRSASGGLCEGRHYRLILVLVDGEWRVIPGSILKGIMEPVEVWATVAKKKVSLDEFFPRNCRLGSQAASPETCVSIENLLRQCGFTWGAAGEVLDEEWRNGDELALLEMIDTRLRETACRSRGPDRREDRPSRWTQEGHVPHRIVARAGDGARREREVEESEDVTSDAGEKGACSLGYDVSALTFLDRSVAQIELFVAVKGLDGEDCHVEQWVMLCVRSGDEWLLI